MRASDPIKNQKIKETYAATKERRKGQTCKVFEVKVQRNKLNVEQRVGLHMTFVEGKWFYNHLLAMSKTTSIFDIDYTDIEEVIHYSKDGEEVHSELQYLSSQMRRGVINGIRNSIKGLSNAKKNGNNIGALKFISEYRSIDLPQANISYSIKGKNRVKVQGIKKPLKVLGLEQITSLDEYELANAKLVQRNDNYYLMITAYVPKEKREPKQRLGVDFGCQTTLTTSDGQKRNLSIEEPEQIKEVKRRISRSVKGSNNRWKLRKRLRRLNERQTNRKNDLANKVCHELSDYSIVMQDEQIANWAKGGHGKAVTKGVLGRVKNILSHREDTIILSKWAPTTKLCTCCGEKVNLRLSDRTFVCPHCGAMEDRDVHAAKNMLWFAENNIGIKNPKSGAERIDVLEDISKKLGTLFPNSETLNQEATKSATKSPTL